MALDERIADAPNDARLYLQRAQLHGEHEEWSRAFKDYETAKTLDPSLETGLLRGKALLAAGHPKAALVLLNDFLRRHPQHWQALLCRARVLGRLDRRQDSLGDYREALKLTTMPEPDLVLEAADAHAATGLADEAVRILDGGIEKLGRPPALVIRVIDLEVSMMRFDNALLRIDKMAATAPVPGPWLARRASVLAQAGRYDESMEAWKILLDRLASLPDAERGSHAMNILKEQAQQAMASLGNMSANAQSPTTP